MNSHHTTVGMCMHSVAQSCPTLPGSSMGFSRQEYCSEFPFPLPGYFPDPRTEPASPELAGRFFTIEPPGKPTTVGTDNIQDKEMET